MLSSPLLCLAPPYASAPLLAYPLLLPPIPLPQGGGLGMAVKDPRMPSYTPYSTALLLAYTYLLPPVQWCSQLTATAIGMPPYELYQSATTCLGVLPTHL